jgi:heme exporter protein A
MGPNGAGKTTLLRILSTLSRPTRGTVAIAGHALPKGADKARRQIGFLSHQPLLYGELSAEENLRSPACTTCRRAVGASTRCSNRSACDRRRDRVRTFSRGMQQRWPSPVLLHDLSVVSARRAVHRLGPDAADRLAGWARDLHDGKRTHVMTTHDLDRAPAPATGRCSTRAGGW